MDDQWWRGAVVYQIYPRSFYDANGDGIGDLKGVTSKLDYVASLGVDAIWLSPFFASPMKDFGYDVSDYRAVDPMFGSLEDFDLLIDKAHSLGLKVMIDQVISHTSDQHAWFKESRKDKNNPKADWYIWADCAPDGTPPNNWLSVFGGSAWEWDPGRKQFFMHNFLASQPDLNFHNPEVTDQVLSDMRYWLERGVDGFRLDTANFYFHDEKLRNNPVNEASGGSADISNDANLYTKQVHLYNKSRPENVQFMIRVRELLDEFPGSTTVGEIGSENSLEMMAEYTGGGDKLHMAYTFDLLCNEFSASHIKEVVTSLESKIGDGWPCWALSNHDVVRVATRWAAGHTDDRLTKSLMAMLLCLRGSICVYQGEELGLREADVPFEKLQDPYGISFWPAFKGRDGCRTPMPWEQANPQAGFSAVEPWLPLDIHHFQRAVDQHGAEDSFLNFFRSVIAWRCSKPEIVKGDFEWCLSPTDILAFKRTFDGSEVWCAFNLADEHRELKIDSCPVLKLEPFGCAWMKSRESKWQTFECLQASGCG